MVLYNLLLFFCANTLYLFKLKVKGSVIHIFLTCLLINAGELFLLPGFLGFLELSDSGDCFKATKCVTFIITFMLRGASCFGSGFETLCAAGRRA